MNAAVERDIGALVALRRRATTWGKFGKIPHMSLYRVLDHFTNK